MVRPFMYRKKICNFYDTPFHSLSPCQSSRAVYTGTHPSHPLTHSFLLSLFSLSQSLFVVPLYLSHSLFSLSLFSFSLMISSPPLFSLSFSLSLSASWSEDVIQRLPLSCCYVWMPKIHHEDHSRTIFRRA